jgi:hypothetical protein
VTEVCQLWLFSILSCFVDKQWNIYFYTKFFKPKVGLFNQEKSRAGASSATDRESCSLYPYAVSTKIKDELTGLDRVPRYLTEYLLCFKGPDILTMK